MKISIIIPVYKVECYLRRCLDSVINQTYKDIEIILVDDGSPDNCGEICDEYAQVDSRITVVHKENEGLSEARNTGMEIMTGEYVYFVDSDDFIDTETIELLQRRLNHTRADIIIGNFKFIDEHDQITPRKQFEESRFEKKQLESSKTKFNYFFGQGYGTNAWNKLYKTSFIKLLNMKFEKNDDIFAEDILFNLKLFINNPAIELVNEYTYYYMINTSSITNTFKKNLTKRYLSLLESFYSYAQKLDKLTENNDLVAFNVFTAIDNTCLNSYKYSENKFIAIKSELNEFKKSIIVTSAIVDLSKGKYLREVSRRDWSFFAWVFSVVYGLNLINISSILLIIRFKIK